MEKKKKEWIELFDVQIHIKYKNGRDRIRRSNLTYAELKTFIINLRTMSGRVKNMRPKGKKK